MCVVLKRMKPEFVKSCFEQLGPDVRTHNNVIHKRKANGRKVFVCPWNKNGEQNGHHRPTQARIVISCCEQHARTRDLIGLSHKTHAQHVMLVGRAASSCAVFSGFFFITTDVHLFGLCTDGWSTPERSCCSSKKSWKKRQRRCSKTTREEASEVLEDLAAERWGLTWRCCVCNGVRNRDGKQRTFAKWSHAFCFKIRIKMRNRRSLKR